MGSGTNFANMYSNEYKREIVYKNAVHAQVCTLPMHPGKDDRFAL
jgi:hypothetical protein